MARSEAESETASPDPVESGGPNSANEASDHAHGSDVGTGRLVGGILLNLGISVAEAIAGVLSGSLALLADAAHNLNDTASLGLSLYARTVAGRDPTESRTFGHRRAEVIGAFVNLITLVLIALYLIVEAVERALNPRPVDGQIVMLVAGLALAGNVATAWLLHRPSKESLNIEAAYVHIIADALASVGVLIAGAIVLGFGWTWVDPVMTGLISVYILWQSARMLRRTIDILMMTAPEDLDIGEMVAAMEAVNGVEDVHHVHVWRLDEQRTALEAHVRIGERDVDVAERVKQDVKNQLASAFDIGHATLEVEYERCSDTSPATGESTHPSEPSVQGPTPPVIAPDC